MRIQNVQLAFALIVLAVHEPRGELADARVNLSSELDVKFAFYPQRPGDSIIPDYLIEDSPILSEARYSAETWFNTGNNIRIDAAGWFEYGLPYNYRWKGGFELFQDEENLSRPVVLNELSATRALGPLDLLAGRAIRRNTLSVLYPLADRYVARDFNDPINPKILGVWQVRGDYYIGDWTGSLSALPVFQPPKVPGIESRWWIRRITPITGEPLPPGATGRVERSIPSVSVENTGLLAEIASRGRQWDFFSSFYHGYTPYAVTRFEETAPDHYLATLEYLPGFEWAGGVSTTIRAFELHAETLYHRSYSGDDDDYINGLIGTVWRTDGLARMLHCDQIHLIIEYAREHILSEQDPSSGYASSSEPFRLGRDTLFAKGIAEITARDTAAVACVHDFDDDTAFVQLRGGRRFGNGVQLELVTDLFFGEGLYFGEWRHNNRIYLNYRYSF